MNLPAEIQKQLDNIRDFLQSTDLVTKQIPMLSVLIVFARLRAKVDLEGTDPMPYAQNAFLAIGSLVAIQAGALFFDTCENSTLKVVNIVVFCYANIACSCPEGPLVENDTPAAGDN